MDYEKMYNEALERAKKFEEKYGGGYAEYIFPELAESEDERIKKTIRQLLETARDAHSNTSLAKPFIDALAWLEKQKESLHIPETCKENADSFTDIKDRNIRGCIGMALADISESRFKMYGVTLKECLAWLEKQKEPENTSASTMAPSCWAEEPSLQKEPKPAWSEEDIKKIRSEEYTKGFNDAAFGSKLKEWSVEDEDRIRQIERIAQEAGCTQKLQEEIHDWLKSLRPSWKPSEEQMEALEAATVRYQSTGLESLYEDLKKL